MVLYYLIILSDSAVNFNHFKLGHSKLLSEKNQVGLSDTDPSKQTGKQHSWQADDVHDELHRMYML